MLDESLETQDVEALAEQERLAKLAAFAETIARHRKEAIDGRRMSGIEQIWREDEEYYAGIDDANRSQMMFKPATPDGRLIMKGGNSGSTRSTVFVNITQPYVDMAAARVSDMLLPTDDKPFAIRPTPIPEVAKYTDSGDMMPDGQATVGDAAKQFIREMEEKAQNAETQIWDWLVESRWHGEVRRVIEQCARLGTSVLKGPYPVKRKSRIMNNDEATGDITLTIQEEIKPASSWLDVWRFYPDPACGDNIHSGRYVIERGDISARKLRELKGIGYIDSEIDEILKEGPGKKNLESGKYNPVADNEMYEIWYYTGFADAESLRAAGCDCEDDANLPVLVTMVNDRIIKASLNVLNSGEFPYDVMRWQYDADTWTGTGVARQVRTAQNMVNAASRNLMDNAGLSAGPQIAIRRDAVYPADGVWEITPRKLWFVDDDADIQDVQHAITSIAIPTMQVELQNIIKMALEFAERATSMPLLLQGQQGASTETVGGMQILQANASTVLRRIAKISDDDVTEPHVLRYYDWLMQYSDNEDAKGDFTVEAIGSTAFYERDAQAQLIMQLLPLSANPAFGLKPFELMQEVLKANKISVNRVQMSDEEIKQQQAAAQQNPPTDPRIEGQKQVAEIKAQTDMQKAQLVQQSDREEIAAKRDAMQSEMALKLQMQREEQEHQERIEQLRYEVKMMELAQAQQVSLDSIKAALASDSMKLRTQKELSVMNQQVKQVSTPETEPVGRAKPGHAYEQ